MAQASVPGDAHYNHMYVRAEISSRMLVYMCDPVMRAKNGIRMQAADERREQETVFTMFEVQYDT